MVTKSKPFVVVKSNEGPDWTTCRNPTELELNEAKAWKVLAKATADRILELEREIEKLEAKIEKCPHSLCVDEQGWLYDIRACFACGKGMGQI